MGQAEDDVALGRHSIDDRTMVSAPCTDGVGDGEDVGSRDGSSVTGHDAASPLAVPSPSVSRATTAPEATTSVADVDADAP